MKLLGSLLFLLLSSRLYAQAAPPLDQFTSRCSESERIAILEKSDPAYPYAVKLAQFLSDRGIRVECVCASKMQLVFTGQRSAAWFQTGDGIFDALFLPIGQNFQVALVDRPQDGWHHYSFSGVPASKMKMDSKKPAYLVQRKNVLLFLFDDQPLARILERVLDSD